MGEKECDKCLKLDPNFIKAWERKGRCHIMMSQYDKAMKAFDEGLKLDPNHSGCSQGKHEAQAKIMGYGMTQD